jgi:hypothetical protein
MERYRVDIKGLTPLVMHNPSEILNPPEKGRDKAKWERDHWKERMYIHPDGALYLPGRSLFKAAISACRFIADKPKGTTFKSWGPMVEAVLLVTGDIEPLNVKVSDAIPWESVVNLDPSKGPKGPKGCRVRPMFRAWDGSVEVVVVDPILDESTLGMILDRAGRFGGLGDGRAVGMGRCAITVKKIAGD